MKNSSRFLLFLMLVLMGITGCFMEKGKKDNGVIKIIISTQENKTLIKGDGVDSITFSAVLKNMDGSIGDSSSVKLKYSVSSGNYNEFVGNVFKSTTPGVYTFKGYSGGIESDNVIIVTVKEKSKLHSFEIAAIDNKMTIVPNSEEKIEFYINAYDQYSNTYIPQQKVKYYYEFENNKLVLPLENAVLKTTTEGQYKITAICEDIESTNALYITSKKKLDNDLDMEAVQQVKKWLTFDRIKDANTTTSSITSDLKLIKSFPETGVNITWSAISTSSNASINVDTGMIKRDSKNVEIQLTAKIYKNNAYDFVVFKLVIIKEELQAIKCPNEIISVSLSGSSRSIGAYTIPDVYANTLYYTSSNKDVIKVTDNGVVTAVSSGSAIITVKSTENPELSAQCTVKVGEAPIQIQINFEDFDSVSSLELNKTMTAKVVPNNADQNVIWTSSLPNSVAINEKGELTILKAGLVQIRCTSAVESRIYDEVLLYASIPVEKVEVEQSHITLTKNNRTAVIKAKISPPEAEQALSISSSNPSVVQGDPSGLIIGYEHGTAVLKVRSYDIKSGPAEAIINVTVDFHPEEIIISPAAITLTTQSVVQFSSVVLPEGAPQDVEWQVSDPNLAEIDLNGRLIAKKSGSVTVSAISKSHPDVKGTANVNINFVLTKIEGDKSIIIGIGETKKLKAVPVPYGAPNNFIYHSVAEDVATVDENGYVTGISEGESIVRIKSGTNDVYLDTYVVVIAKPREIKLSLPEYFVTPGTLMKLTSSVLPAGANQGVRYETSNSSVVEILESGHVKALQPGVAKIWAISVEDSTIKTSVELKVTASVVNYQEGDQEFRVIVPSASGYMVGGLSFNETSGTSNIELYNFNAGTVSNWKSYGGSGDEVVTSMIATEDGGYLIAGYTKSTDLPGLVRTVTRAACYLLKVNSDGNIGWQQAIEALEINPDSDAARFTSVIKLYDGDYLAVGTAYPKIVARKFNSAGEIKWTKYYDYNNNGVPVELAEGYGIVTSDNKIILAGHGLIKADTDICVMNINYNGDVIWTKLIEKSKSDYMFGMAAGKNGEFYINRWNFDWTNLANNNVSDYVTMKLSSGGDIIWEQSTNGIFSNVNQMIADETGVLWTGLHRKSDETKTMAVVKYDLSGNKLYENFYGGNGFDEGFGLLSVVGGYYLVGRVTSFDVPWYTCNGREGAIFKITKDGVLD